MQTTDQEAEQTEGGGVYIWDRDGYRISWWEDNVAIINLGTDTNDPLDYAPGLEHHHPIISMVRELEIQLERDNRLVKTPIGKNNNLYKMI